MQNSGGKKSLWYNILILHAAGINCLRPQTGTLTILKKHARLSKNGNMRKTNTNKILNTINQPIQHKCYIHIIQPTTWIQFIILFQELPSMTMKNQNVNKKETFMFCSLALKSFTITLNNRNLSVSTQVKSNHSCAYLILLCTNLGIEDPFYFDVDPGRDPRISIKKYGSGSGSRSRSDLVKAN